MGFTREASDIIRRRSSNGKKRCVVIADDDTFVRALTQDRTSLGVTGRVNVAFLTPEEYRQWQQARHDHSQLPTCPQCQVTPRSPEEG